MYTSGSNDLIETRSSKDSFKYTSIKRSEAQTPIYLPTIKNDLDYFYESPVVEIKKIKKEKLMENVIQRNKARQALRVTDVTESLSKDLPRTLFRTIVITPKQKSKIFATIVENVRNETVVLGRLGKRADEARNRSSSPPKRKIENKIRDITENTEYGGRRKHNLSVRPVSPWMYQGNSRRFSIFSKVN
jgi:hypothetical protein